MLWQRPFMASTVPPATRKLADMRRPSLSPALPLWMLLIGCGGTSNGHTGEVPVTTGTTTDGGDPSTGTTGATTDPTADPTGDNGADAAITYYRDIKPLLDAAASSVIPPETSLRSHC